MDRQGGNKEKMRKQLVEIFFDTARATFDDIEQDKKIKTEAHLSLIGGTMGLLTGFSIISGIEPYSRNPESPEEKKTIINQFF